MSAIKYLASNGISVRSFLIKNPFPKKPFELKGSEKFIESVKFDKYEVVKEALDNNKNYLTQYDYMKQTGFHWAAKLGYSRILNLLLDYGNCCNSYDEKYRTPLYLAAVNNQKDCVIILLQRGGNPLMPDLLGRKPADVAQDDDVRNLLMGHVEKSFLEINGISNEKDNNNGSNSNFNLIGKKS